MSLSTHVLDATSGRPAVGVPVHLEAAGDDGWAAAGEGRTGPDGSPFAYSTYRGS
jgi:5-hydroxyisourate hydrolase